MDLRPYRPADRDACLAVFDSNTPGFFEAHERAGFAEFLLCPNHRYFVMQHDGAIVGCGGYCVWAEQARLEWGMVRREWHRQGLGRFLLLFRLREITKTGGVQMVGVGTSQHAAPFFVRQGFKVVSVEKDGYAAGLDRVELTMKLSVCP